MFKNLKTYISPIFAGILISFGGLTYLNVGGVYGSILFSFGLLAIIYYNLSLFTGQAGFFNVLSRKAWCSLGITYIGNIIGCFIVAMIVGQHDMASNIIDDRITDGMLNNCLKAMCCGFIMTLIVQGGRCGNFLLVVFGVAVFILCGFYHSIADAFYMFTSEGYLVELYWWKYYPLAVLGNFIGCNIPRYLVKQ